MEARKTYRLVATDFMAHFMAHEGGVIKKEIPGGHVCIDVQLRGPKEGVEAVGEYVHAFLNVGPFIGNWVDSGTERGFVGCSQDCDSEEMHALHLAHNKSEGIVE